MISLGILPSFSALPLLVLLAIGVSIDTAILLLPPVQKN